jgi:hypothetical protein
MNIKVIMDTKKINDTLSVLEAQLDSAYQRVDDPYHVESKAWLAGQIVKLEIEINKLKRQIK